jgi:hypothetical protein
MKWQSLALLKKRSSRRGNPYDRVSVRTHTRDEPAFVGLLPNWKLWTRSMPGFYHVTICPFLAGNVLEEIEDQGINGVGHG